MLTLTKSAKDVLRDMVAAGDTPEGSGLRIAADTGGADGAPLSLSLAPAPAQGDEVVDDDGVRVFLEPAAASLLDDKVLDATEHDDHVHFTVGDQAGG